MSDPNAPFDGSTAAATAPGPVVGVLAPIRDTTIAPYDPHGGSQALGPAVDPMAGGLDYVRILHALRRRGLLALALGAVILGAL